MPSSAIATLVEMVESLPEPLQDKVVEHLKEYILKSNITAIVNSDGKLEIPTEIETQLQPRERYTVTVTADSIVFQKVKAGFDWEEWERRMAATNPDPDELTMEEICELVREVRRDPASYTSRREFLQLPLEERRNILAKQADVMLQYYQEDREWQELEAVDLIDY